MKIRVTRVAEILWGDVEERYALEVKEGFFSGWQTIYEKYLTEDEALAEAEKLRSIVENHIVKEYE